MALVQDPTNPTGVTDTRADKGGTGGAARARERKAYAALELKKRDYSWHEIAETLGYPNANAALRAVEQALETGILSEESQQLMRQMAGRRLEEMLHTLRSDAIDKASPDRFNAIKESRALIETHMKLYGYAAPAEVAIYNPLDAEVQEFVSEMIRRRNDGKQLAESNIFDTDPDDDDDYQQALSAPQTVAGELVQSLNTDDERVADYDPFEYPQPEGHDVHPVTAADVQDF